MKHNVGSVDAAIRTVAGILIIMIGHHYRSWWGLAGIPPVLSAITGCCLLYWPFGLNTCSPEELDPSHGAHSSS